MDPALVISIAIIISFILIVRNRTSVSPVPMIINRWLRWAIFATGGALILNRFGISEQPYWVLVGVLAVVWLMGETLYNWMAIKALSESPLPLFPRYKASSSGEEWPTLPAYLTLREDIRRDGFSHLQSLRAEITEGIAIRTSIFQTQNNEMRLQVTFLPQSNGALSMCMSLSSLTADGHRYVTDNLYLPYAGFYPEEWHVERNPWRRSLQGIMHRHNERLKKNTEHLVPWTTDPLEDLNAQQSMLERLNVELGFLTPHANREENGKVTSPGRYRIWKEIWTLNYFGCSARYE